ncbi:hypothetical protein A4H97_29870 [Niastella yeongjuensis]|uniref:Uncharacterized protein n=1 Tax=Niastella yeongjuensis TaxID=354355 RepID=A0A1V9EPK0_9BACT|nr:hypothetical protein [Niastella yeongjuensis]OQP48046.1 hypothetical protein A4H97_29870 [Niastella yeongjuensis]SEO24675.1 hypothetical protein SAMN05660816_02374 [Niastella yeongjuensis]
MKRIRIMLMSMVVLAAVGGALAFNAKKNIRTFCTDPNPAHIPGNLASITAANNCNALVLTSTTVQPNPAGLKYITPTVLQVCQFPANANCPAFYSIGE